MKKLMIVPAGMMLAAGCALFASGFGELKEAWTEEVDLSKAKVYVSIYMEGACGGGCGGKSRASVYAVARAAGDFMSDCAVGSAVPTALFI